MPQQSTAFSSWFKRPHHKKVGNILKQFLVAGFVRINMCPSKLDPYVYKAVLLPYQRLPARAGTCTLQDLSRARAAACGRTGQPCGRTGRTEPQHVAEPGRPVLQQPSTL